MILLRKLNHKVYSVLKWRERPQEFRISTVELEFLFQVFQNIPVTEFIRSTLNLESGFNGRSYGSTMRIEMLAWMEATDSPEGKLCSHANGFGVAGAWYFSRWFCFMHHFHMHTFTRKATFYALKCHWQRKHKADNVSTAMFPWLNFLRDFYFTQQPTRCQSS